MLRLVHEQPESTKWLYNARFEPQMTGYFFFFTVLYKFLLWDCTEWDRKQVCVQKKCFISHRSVKELICFGLQSIFIWKNIRAIQVNKIFLFKELLQSLEGGWSKPLRVNIAFPNISTALPSQLCFTTLKDPLDSESPEGLFLSPRKNVQL